MQKFDKEAEELYNSYVSAFAEDSEGITLSMLKTYCIVCAQINELNARIKKEGYMIRDEAGKLKENPVVNTVHKLNADKARYYAPLKRILNKQHDEAVAASLDDDLDNFLGL